MKMKQTSCMLTGLDSSMTQEMNQYNDQYGKLIALYDTAEKLVEAVRYDDLEHAVRALNAVEPLVEDVESAADTLTEQFCDLAEGGWDGRKLKKNKVETALRRIFAGIQKYSDQSDELFEVIRARVSAVVKELRELTEEIVAIFLVYVRLSVEKIMHKNDIDDMKRRKQYIALMLHEAGLAPKI